MLAAALLILLAASANAAWVRPTARFAAPSGSPLCQYICPAIPKFTVTPDETAPTTSACNYEPKPFPSVPKDGTTNALADTQCTYNTDSLALIDAESGAACEGTTANADATNFIERCPETFAGTIDDSGVAYIGTYELVAINFVASEITCFYTFTFDPVKAQTCVYANSDGALASISPAGADCPTEAEQTCALRRRKMFESRRTQIIRERQFKPVKIDRV